MIFNTVAAFGAAAAAIAGVAAAPASTLEKRCTEPSGIKQGKSFDRAFFIFFENEDRSTVINDPTYASFAKKGINHNNYVAVAHPSQPNYVAYVSGSTNGVTGDSNTNIAASSIADRLEAAGISWSIYAENLPSGCYASATATGGYARKHEPFISFNNIRNNSTRCSEHIKPASQFADDVANGNVAQFTAMIPNLNDDGHDTNTSYSGAWLKNFYGQYTDFFTKTNTLLHLVYDESESYTSNNGVYSVLLGPPVPASKVGSTDSTSYNHYSMLKTVENNWGLSALTSNDSNATPFGGLVRNNTVCA